MAGGLEFRFRGLARAADRSSDSSACNAVAWINLAMDPRPGAEAAGIDAPGKKSFCHRTKYAVAIFLSGRQRQ